MSPLSCLDDVEDDKGNRVGDANGRRVVPTLAGGLGLFVGGSSALILAVIFFQKLFCRGLNFSPGEVTGIDLSFPC